MFDTVSAPPTVDDGCLDPDWVEPELTPEREAVFRASFEAIVAEYAAEEAARPTLSSGPGVGLAGLLAQAEPARLDEFDLVEAIAAWGRVAAWVAAGQARVIDELARRFEAAPPGSPAPAGEGLGWERCLAAELAAALRISGLAAGIHASWVLGLRRLPGTRAALAAGRIDLAKARAIVDAVSELDDALAVAVEAAVLERAGDWTPPQLRQRLWREVLKVDPGAAARRHARKKKDRDVRFHSHPDGMAELNAYGPADEVAAMYGAVDAQARQAATPEDARSLDERRFDTMHDLLTNNDEQPATPAETAETPAEAPAEKPGPAGEPVPAPVAPPRALGKRQAQVIVGLGTLLCLNDEPGELAGHGPIPAQMARRLAADADWRRLIIDELSGQLLDYGRATYRPPAALRDFITARDRACRFPGCRQPARRCDLDHTIPYPHGGTDRANLGALCQHHHRLKHEGGWALKQHPDAVFEWTSPTGHTYLVEPDPYEDRFWATEPEWPPDPDG